MVRSHEPKSEGFEVTHSGRCVTIFSAPNYCGMKNKGALLRFFGPDLMMQPSIISFNEVKNDDFKNEKQRILDME